MLKSELRHKKSLNFVLFVFISIASLLVFVSSVQIYASLIGKSKNNEYCNASDIEIICQVAENDIKTEAENMKAAISAEDCITDCQLSYMVMADNNQVEFTDREQKSLLDVTDSYAYICPQPRVKDLVYDTGDKPFYVENGTIAVNVRLKSMTGLKIGDRIRFTSDSGNIYEFTVSHFFKEPISDYFCRFIISDGDYEQLSDEYFRHCVMIGINSEYSYDYLEPILREKEDVFRWAGSLYVMYHSKFDNELIISFIVSVFLAMISVAIIVIIIVTVRFTIVTSLKEEEKEIGTLRALGIDFRKFRWVFAGKYIVFSIVGGIIGVFSGIPISTRVLNTFSPNTIAPSATVRMTVGTVAVVLLCAVMIAFCLIFMERMKNISAIDALHGENHGERYGRSSAFFMHRSKKTAVPLFLAAADVFGHFLRYLFPVLSYTLGIAVILSSFHIRNSITCGDFIKYLGMGNIDFDFSSELIDSRFYISTNYEETYKLIEKELLSKGIPVTIQPDHRYDDAWLDGEERSRITLVSGVDDLSYLQLHGEGRYPELENEIMLSYYSANKHGISLGDIVTVEVPVNYDGEREPHDFVVTAFCDVLELEQEMAFVGREFKSGYREYCGFGTMKINAPENEKPGYIRMMRQIYGEENVYDLDQIIKEQLSDYDTVFSLLERFMTVTVLCVLILITMLYMNIFVSEDRQAIGLVRTIGFTKGDVRIWQVGKIALILTVSLILAWVSAYTLGAALVSRLFQKLTLTGFRFIIDPVDTYLTVPLITAATVLLTAFIRFIRTKDISIHDITEE